MYRHIVAVLVFLVVVLLKTLFDLWYNHRAEKTATAKKLGEEKGISVWEAEWRLNTNLFLDKIPKWEPGGPHDPYLSENVCPCRGHQVKRVWLQNPPGSLAAIARERCPGRGSHHRTVNTWDHPRRDNGDIPSVIPTKEKTWRSTLFPRHGRRDLHRDSGDPEGMSPA